MDVRREEADDDAPSGFADEAKKAFCHPLLATGRVLRVDVRGIGAKKRYAAIAELAEALFIEGFAVDRGVVELEVARVDHRSRRRLDGERRGIRDRVRDADRFDHEGADDDLLTRTDRRHAGVK